MNHSSSGRQVILKKFTTFHIIRVLQVHARLLSRETVNTQVYNIIFFLHKVKLTHPSSTCKSRFCCSKDSEREFCRPYPGSTERGFQSQPPKDTTLKQCSLSASCRPWNWFYSRLICHPKNVFSGCLMPKVVSVLMLYGCLNRLGKVRLLKIQGTFFLRSFKCPSVPGSHCICVHLFLC